MKLSILLIVLMALIEWNNVNAQDKSNDTTAKYFIIQASIGNLQEIAIGKLAVEQGGSPEVKNFANRMVTDHGNAQEQVTQLIRSRGLQIPKEATDTPAEDLMLKNMKGKNFDRLYVHMMVPDHRQAVQLFEKYALAGKDPAVRAFAEQTLPTLKEHLAAIVAIEEAMKDEEAK
jgi:putative membrane protein